MALLQDSESRRGFFGETITEYPVDVNLATDTLVDQVYQRIVDRVDPISGPLQFFHVLQGWRTINLEEARKQLVEHLQEPLRRHRSLEETTLHDAKLAFTTGGLQIRKPGEPPAIWRMDLKMTLVERKGDGNVTYYRDTNSFAGQKKGIFESPLSFCIRQLAR